MQLRVLEKPMLRRSFYLACLLILASSSLTPAVLAQKLSQKLEGRIESEDFRIHKPKDSSRIVRPQAQPQQEQQPLTDSSPVDGNAFAAPLAGRADETKLKSSAVQSDDFAKLPKGFDIGADKGSRELVLAWEKWHKQLAGAIYQVWNNRANSAGRAIMKVTVWRNKEIRAEFMTCTGDSAFRHSITSVFDDINGNPGLTFPAKSERQQVSFEAEYIAGSQVKPGYSWLKGDYEKVQKDY